MQIAQFSAAERLERLPISGYHRIIFIIIALAFFFDSMDLAMMTFLLGSIKTEFGLSSAEAGLLASSSFFGMVLGASLSGMLADRFGRKPVFQWSIVLWGIASYLCSTAQNVETLTLFRILLGIGMGMEFPIAQSMLSELIPAKGRGRSFTSTKPASAPICAKLGLRPARPSGVVPGRISSSWSRIVTPLRSLTGITELAK